MDLASPRLPLPDSVFGDEGEAAPGRAQSEWRHRVQARRQAAGRDPVLACALCRLGLHPRHLPERRGNRPAESCFAVQWGDGTQNPCKAKRVVEM